ncbi:hypothetical protein K438DRAFT_1762586 [Mycena galopus ATCC 62051]|nr:hypothetical protein K438DRAFT_1762586 [Mycena galopus ATCC 62051]
MLMFRQLTGTKAHLDQITMCLTLALPLLKELNDAFGPPFVQPISSSTCPKGSAMGPKAHGHMEYSKEYLIWNFFLRKSVQIKVLAGTSCSEELVAEPTQHTGFKFKRDGGVWDLKHSVTAVLVADSEIYLIIKLALVAKRCRQCKFQPGLTICSVTPEECTYWSGRRIIASNKRFRGCKLAHDPLLLMPQVKRTRLPALKRGDLKVRETQGTYKLI